MTIIKKDGVYSIIKQDNRYEVYCEEEVLKTPNGSVAHTMYLPIAEQLLKDWKEQGYDSYYTAVSLLSFHFSMIEYFAKLSKKEILEELNSMNWDCSWVFNGCPSANPTIWMKWISYFGQGESKAELIREWLRNQTHMQLAASTCLYNAFMDFNVPYYMAYVVECIPEEEQDPAIKEFFDFYSLFDNMYDYDDFFAIFDRFRLYYGIHFKDYGPHLPEGDNSE